MKIEISEKGSKAFYKEIISVSVMCRKLIKNPIRKLKNVFKEYTILLISCIILGSYTGIMAFSFPEYKSSYLAMTAVMVFCTIISIVYLVVLNKALKNYLNANTDKVLTLDEDGIQLDDSGNIYRIAWNNVAFTRSFKESLCFVANEQSKMIIGVDRKYEDQILQYIADNNIECRRVG